MDAALAAAASRPCLAASAALGASFAGLILVGASSFRRTRGLRLGREAAVDGASPRRVPPPPGPVRLASSPTTFLAAGAGLSALATSALAGGTAPAVRAGLAIAGGVALVEGLRGRVTGLTRRRASLLVRYAGRRPFPIRVRDLVEVRPPRWPLGGWRVRTSAGARTLMPSDLLGHEVVLGALIAAAALRFDRGAWRGPGAPGPPCCGGWPGGAN